MLNPINNALNIGAMVGGMDASGVRSVRPLASAANYVLVDSTYSYSHDSWYPSSGVAIFELCGSSSGSRASA